MEEKPTDSGRSAATEQKSSKAVSRMASTLPHITELVTLSDLAGIQAPENVMKILIELVAVGMPPPDIHRLLRTILSNYKKIPHRSGSKHSSRRTHTHAEGSPSTGGTSTN